MTNSEILKIVDHTLLKQTATWEQIKKICDDGIKYNVASVCIPSSFVKKAKEYTNGKLTICTVIGFPNGYMTTAAKVFETMNAVKNGADEIDMVINVGAVKDGKYQEIEDEIKAVKNACVGKLLKVIIETCLLTEDEKIRMCEVVSNAKADFIKTSTGFSTGGATLEDVKLMKQYVNSTVKIKAAGGVSSFEDGEAFIKAGADRLGTSRLIPVKTVEKETY